MEFQGHRQANSMKTGTAKKVLEKLDLKALTNSLGPLFPHFKIKYLKRYFMTLLPCSLCTLQKVSHGDCTMCTK